MCGYNVKKKEIRRLFIQEEERESHLFDHIINRKISNTLPFNNHNIIITYTDI